MEKLEKEERKGDKSRNEEMISEGDKKRGAKSREAVRTRGRDGEAVQLGPGAS